jgi:hypothetical protein
MEVGRVEKHGRNEGLKNMGICSVGEVRGAGTPVFQKKKGENGGWLKV